mgnify:CR=1 FL=1
MCERTSEAASYVAHVGAAAACLVRASSCAEALGASGLFDGPAAIGDRTPAAPNRALALVIYANGPTDAFSERFPAESLFFVEDLHPSAFEAAPAPADAQALWLVPALSAWDLRIADVRALAAAAHARGALLALDVSATTSYCSAAFELGADLCLERLDADGEGDAAAASDIALSRTGLQPRWALSVARPRRKRRDEAAAELNCLRAEIVGVLGGAQHAGDAQALLDRDARTQRRCDHARALAEYLSCCDAVPGVVYPGLPTHPDHALAAQALRHGAGFVLDFEVPSSTCAAAFIARAARHRAHPGISGAAGAAASDSYSSKSTAVVPAIRTAPAAGAAPAPGSPCACEPLAVGAPLASEPDARTRLLARDGAGGRFVRLVAGLDNPLAIADDLDQALRWFCNPPEP